MHDPIWLACADPNRAFAMHKQASARGYRGLIFPDGVSALAEFDRGQHPIGMILDLRLRGILGSSVVLAARELDCQAPAIILGEVYLPTDSWAVTLSEDTSADQALDTLEGLMARYRSQTLAAPTLKLSI